MGGHVLPARKRRLRCRRANGPASGGGPARSAKREAHVRWRPRSGHVTNRRRHRTECVMSRAGVCGGGRNEVTNPVGSSPSETGYSGTPLAKKLGIREGSTVA